MSPDISFVTKKRCEGAEALAAGGGVGGVVWSASRLSRSFEPHAPNIPSREADTTVAHSLVAEVIGATSLAREALKNWP
ncbi:MAG: hypothetical protein WD647_12110 [Steroidobacteraceae bacterium]